MEALKLIEDGKLYVEIGIDDKDLLKFSFALFLTLTLSYLLASRLVKKL
jgi:hypothetical protein